MNNALDPLPSNVSGYITCHYVNASSRLQIARISNIANWYFERVVFPGQHLVFQAFPEAFLEVHASEMATTILADRIPCTQIRMAEPTELPANISSSGSSSTSSPALSVANLNSEIA